VDYRYATEAGEKVDGAADHRPHIIGRWTELNQMTCRAGHSVKSFSEVPIRMDICVIDYTFAKHDRIIKAN